MKRNGISKMFIVDNPTDVGLSHFELRMQKNMCNSHIGEFGPAKFSSRSYFVLDIIERIPHTVRVCRMVRQ